MLLHELLEPLSLAGIRPDVAIYPHNVLPFLSLESKSLKVVVLHDLLFLKGPTANSAANRYRRLKLKHSLAHAHLILSVSASSAAEISAFLGTDSEIVVIPNALADIFGRIESPGAPRVAEIPEILHFGGYAPSKNTRAVFEAVSVLKKSGRRTRLVLAAMSKHAELVSRWRAETGLTEEDVEVLPSLSDEELIECYKRASLHCMPSTGEGFGIPIIEAARCGTPNVLSPLPVFREILGERAIFADGFTGAAIAHAMGRCLDSDNGQFVNDAFDRSNAYLFESIHQRQVLPALGRIQHLLQQARV